MSKSYTLNAAGEEAIRRFVAAHGTPGLIADPYLRDAEETANNDFKAGLLAVIAIPRQYSESQEEVELELDRAWFDAANAS